MLSFGDPRPFVAEVRAAGARLICQCQNMEHVIDAVDVGADAVIAQGTEAGGHGALRGGFTFIPEAADYIRVNAPDTLLLAAGGIADGRGLAAALMLGADGVLMGTRLWASREALVNARHHEALIETDGDGRSAPGLQTLPAKLPGPRGLRLAFAETPSPTDGTGGKTSWKGTSRWKAFAIGKPLRTATPRTPGYGLARPPG